MLQSIVEYVAGLVKEQLGIMLQEVIDKVLELLTADEGMIEEWLDTLPPMRRMFAENLLMFAEEILKMVADKLLEEPDPEPEVATV